MVPAEIDAEALLGHLPEYRGSTQQKSKKVLHPKLLTGVAFCPISVSSKPTMPDWTKLCGNFNARQVVEFSMEHR
jgi:hypothetical protein